MPKCQHQGGGGGGSGHIVSWLSVSARHEISCHNNMISFYDATASLVRRQTKGVYVWGYHATTCYPILSVSTCSYVWGCHDTHHLMSCHNMILCSVLSLCKRRQQKTGKCMWSASYVCVRGGSPLCSYYVIHNQWERSLLPENRCRQIIQK